MYAPVPRSSTLFTLTLCSFALLAPGCDDLKPQDAAGAVHGKRFIKKVGKFVKKTPSKRVGKPLSLKASDALALGKKAAPFGMHKPGGGVDPNAPRPGDSDKPSEPPKPPPRAEDGPVAGMTALHNQVRAQVGVAPLQWDPELAGEAQAWADALGETCALEHSQRPPPPKGENLFWYSAVGTAEQAFGAWAAEAENYTYADNTCSGVCGHYTQIIWSNTRYVGCGFRECTGFSGSPMPNAQGGSVFVCNYYPAGNYVGQKPY